MRSMLLASTLVLHTAFELLRSKFSITNHQQLLCASQQKMIESNQLPRSKLKCEYNPRIKVDRSRHYLNFSFSMPGFDDNIQ
jgi:hypothetical protein